jgi:NitT/TauT family transport system permease protein
LYRNGSLFHHVGTTLWETLAGFAIAVILGYSIALLLWWSELFRRVSEPYFVVLNALPKIALGPLIIIWCGTGSKAIVFMTILIGLIVAILNMLNGFMATDENKLLLLKSMGASKLQILTKLVIPSSLPNFISMLKINVGMAWIGSIMGEYIVSKAGIGYLIVYGGQVFKLDLVMSAVFILCILAAAMYALVALLEKAVIKNK